MADLREIAQISLEQEIKHWWIATRFQYIDKTIEQLLFQGKQNLKILELGCGSGQNLYYLRKHSTYSKSISQINGVDPFLPVGYKADWLGVNDSIGQVLPTQEKFDLILAMDVLEHIENPQQLLNTWIPYLDNNGILLVSVPAFMSLWSYQDVHLGHFRRYTKNSVLQLFEQTKLRPLRICYAFSFIFPLVWLIRKVINRNQIGSDDLRPQNPVVNFILKFLGQVEFVLGGNPLFGTSVIAIFQQ